MNTDERDERLIRLGEQMDSALVAIGRLTDRVSELEAAVQRAKGGLAMLSVVGGIGAAVAGIGVAIWRKM